MLGGRAGSEQLGSLYLWTSDRLGERRVRAAGVRRFGSGLAGASDRAVVRAGGLAARSSRIGRTAGRRRLTVHGAIPAGRGGTNRRGLRSSVPIRSTARMASAVSWGPTSRPCSRSARQKRARWEMRSYAGGMTGRSTYPAARVSSMKGAGRSGRSGWRRIRVPSQEPSESWRSERGR